MTTRGIRNNNPLNIRKSADKWQGLSAEQPDSAFFTFKSAVYGIRAGARILINYKDEHGIDTIADAITRWAPPSENDTKSYIKTVSHLSEINATEEVDFHSFEPLFAIIKAMIVVENGDNPYTDAQITKGLVLAGVEPEQQAIGKTKAVKAAQVAAATTAASTCATVVQQLIPAAPIISSVAQYAPYVLAIVTLAAVGFFVWDRLDDRRKGIR